MQRGQHTTKHCKRRDEGERPGACNAGFITNRTLTTIGILCLFFLLIGDTNTARSTNTVTIPAAKYELMVREKRGSHKRIQILNRRVASWRRKAKQARRITPEQAIRMAFGVRAGAALRVARCESGLDPTATNGRYEGLFQASHSLRSGVPGYGPSPIQQATHAYRIFVRSGMSWGPWECKP